MRPLPALSIIVICCNSHDRWDELKSQAFKDIKICISDGGSKQEMVARIEAIAYYLRSGPDIGVYDAMNKGIDVAAGELTLFLNSGDRLASRDSLVGLMAGCENPLYKPGMTTLLGGTIYEHIHLKRRWLIIPMPQKRGLSHMSRAVLTILLRHFRFDDGFRIATDIALWRRMETINLLNDLTVDTIVSIFEYGDGLSISSRYVAIRWVKRMTIDHKIGREFSSLGLIRSLAVLLKAELINHTPMSWRLKIWEMRHGWTPLSSGTAEALEETPTVGLYPMRGPL